MLCPSNLQAIHYRCNIRAGKGLSLTACSWSDDCGTPTSGSGPPALPKAEGQTGDARGQQDEARGLGHPREIDVRVGGVADQDAVARVAEVDRIVVDRRL